MRSAASLRLDVQVGQIAKSAIFKRKEDDAAVLVATSGERPVHEKRVADVVQEA